MSRLEVAVEIAATPADVWAVVERIEDHVDWMADAVAIRFDTEQRRGTGTSFRCDTKVGPITLVDHMEISDWQSEVSIGVRHVGVITGTGQFTLTPIDLGRRTLFTWQETLRFPWWLGARLGATLATRVVLRRIWQGNLRRLKAIVESRPPLP